MAGLILPVLAAPPAHAAEPPATAAFAAVVLPPAPQSAFPPGTWKGVVRASGGISGSGAEGFVVEPFLVRFEIEVAPDGTVVGGVWDWNAAISTAAEGVSGNFDVSASGELGGLGSAVEMSGIVHMAGTVSTSGQVMDVSFDSPAAGSFAPSSATCNSVWGDMATTGREAQAAAGMSTTVKGPFSAHRIANPGAGAGPGFEEAFAQLVTTGEALLAAGTPPSAEVLAFVEDAEDFYHQVFSYSACPGDAATVRPGTQAYTYFVVLVGSLILQALADPSAYDAYELSALAIAAVRIGVIGAAAPDAQLANDVKQVLANALASALLDAEAAGEKNKCARISLTATALGLGDLAAAAAACA